MKLIHIVPLAAAAATSLVGTKARAADPLTAQGIVDEVVSRSESPHAYDWRSATAELEAAVGEVNAANNFDNEVYELAAGIPLGDGSLARFGVRRAQVYATPSSNMVGRTPFRQASLVTRYEVFGGYGFGLLEGRAMTRLSPWLGDVENALFLWGGAHFSHPNQSLVPKRSDDPTPLPGQAPIHAKIVVETGLRWHVYLPRSFGLAFEALYQHPLGGTDDLKSWTYFSGGVLWSFGAR